jgi:hypothetical protein
VSKLFDAQDGDVITLPWGTVELHNNEVHIRSNVADPPGVSFHGYGDCRSLGKVSFKINGREMVLIQGKSRDDNGGGEIYVGVLDEARFRELEARGDTNALDHAMIEVMNIQAHQIEFKTAVKFPGGAAAVNDTIWAPDGLSFTQQQADRNFVTYKVDRPFDKGANPVALWASGTNQ